jgi:hypothetical protein
MFPDKVLTADHVCIPNERVDSIIKTRQNNVRYTCRLKIDDNYNLVNHGEKINHYYHTKYVRRIPELLL